MASDRPDAWQVEVGGAGGSTTSSRRAARRGRSATLTAITGRHRVPPAWARRARILDRAVLFPSRPARPSYEADVRQDLRDIERYRLPLDAYRIEGWQFLPRDVLRELIATLRARGIKPLRLLPRVRRPGRDRHRRPGAYDEAVAKGYVATDADGAALRLRLELQRPPAR